MAGDIEGQTQECYNPYSDVTIWDHPIDIHYTTQSLQGSPKFLAQVFCRDKYDRILFLAYGVASIPLTPGHHTIECHTWKPVGNILFYFFLMQLIFLK